MALTLSPDRIEEIRAYFDQIADAPENEQGRILDAVRHRDWALYQHVGSLLTVSAHVSTLATRWDIALDAPSSPWAQIETLARWLLDQPSLVHMQHLDELDEDGLHAALVNTLVIFQHAPGSSGSASLPVPMSEATASADGASIIGSQVRQYQVLDRLGEGGMGVVYTARDGRLGRTVALKFLPDHLQTDAAARARFEQEARAASSLDHPHVGYIHEIAETASGRLFIAMAYYPGRTLRTMLAEGPLPWGAALDYADQIADGLAAAHQAGIIHRDIKPSNVIVTAEDRAKILDFGLAKVQDVTLTRTKSWLGTVAYMSPEQVRGEAVDARTDIWALGALLYELIAGQRPFPGEYETAVMYSVLNEVPAPLSSTQDEIPDGVQAVIDRCLQKDPDDRYPNVEMLRLALASIRQGRAAKGAGRDPAPSARSSRWSPRRMWGGVLGGLAVLSLLWFVGGRAFPGNAALQPRHLAVLPFQVIGPADEAEVYAAGLLETLTSKITQLEQFHGALWVVPASEISGPMTPSDAQKRFGVSMVVSGSIQLANEQVRLTLNLIDAQTRRQIRSEQIDHRSAGTLSLQNEAILMVARMLRVELKPGEREALTAGGTMAPAANDFYLRGRGYLRNQQSVDDIDLAIRLFEAAVGQDSLFALAYAGLGEAYWQKYRATEDVQWVDAAIQSSQQALTLNAQLAPVYVTLGLIQHGRRQYDAALAAFQRALEIDPFYADAYRRRARVYRSQGQFERAEEAYSKAIELKPGYWRGYNSLGALYYITGRYEAAISQFEQGTALAPENKSLLINLGATYWQLGRLEAAIGAFERVLLVDPDQAAAQANLATAYFYQGRYEHAADLYQAQLDRNPLDYNVQGFLADAYYWMGQRGKADEAYRRAIELVEGHLTVQVDDPHLLGSLASFHARLEQADRAVEYLNRLEAMVDPSESDVVLAFGMGEVYEQMGRREAAFRWMERALRMGYGWMQIDHSPWLEDFRADPGVSRWLASIPRPES